MNFEDPMERQMRDREQSVASIVSFVTEHPNSYASLAVCRRALDGGIEAIDAAVINALRMHLEEAPENEVDAYYSIVM